ncbi:acyl transferase [Methylacidiphilum kamchatkense Kam1]|uniref:Acyl transferase n=1 Tax=Methylacidiphilum kamchatkense Kam1 TaxID=1202785 RepID=A0A0C1RS39_9BACT|nr:putative colanic acid biosynthesis acetyltransferase [Methylacidiphilum kamchatkense]KIE57731.1 acyl transferase [Methylacidiphilum kamchatkense Kam1]QDQ42905.1 putative colanic acid biosynthesis acetyltransferase WcaF [Methylacidiphilum kamchatkense Kam1]
MEEENSNTYQRLDLFQLPVGFRGRPAWLVQLWWIVQDTLFRLSPQFLYGWRRFLLKLFGAEIGKCVLIRPSVQITYPWKVKIGDYSWIGDNVVLYSLGEIEIGEHVVISQRSYLCTGNHRYDKITFDIEAKKIVIEKEVWICTDVFIGPGVRIGRGTVIGARSSVFKDLPSGMICHGNPAKPIRSRQPQE